MMPQAVADDILAAFGCSALLTMLEQGESHCLALSLLATEFVTQCRDRADELAELRTHPWEAVNAVYTNVNRILTFCKCILHLLNTPYPNDCNEDAVLKIQHVLAFSQYTGKQIFERSVRQLLTEQKFWKDQIDEVIRTGASTKSLEPKHAKFKVLIAKDDAFSLEELEQVSSLIVELERGMRKGSIEAEKRAFFKKLMKQGQALLTAPVVQETSSLVKGLLKCLGMFDDLPGALDLRKNIVEHQTTNRGVIAGMELVGVLEAALKARELNEQVLFDALAAVDRASLPDSLTHRMDEFLLEICQLVSAKAG